MEMSENTRIGGIRKLIYDIFMGIIPMTVTSIVALILLIVIITKIGDVVAANYDYSEYQLGEYESTKCELFVITRKDTYNSFIKGSPDNDMMVIVREPEDLRIFEIQLYSQYYEGGDEEIIKANWIEKQLYSQGYGYDDENFRFVIENAQILRHKVTGEVAFYLEKYKVYSFNRKLFVKYLKRERRYAKMGGQNAFEFVKSFITS